MQTRLNTLWNWYKRIDEDVMYTKPTGPLTAVSIPVKRIAKHNLGMWEKMAQCLLKGKNVGLKAALEGCQWVKSFSPALCGPVDKPKGLGV